MRIFLCGVRVPRKQHKVAIKRKRKSVERDKRNNTEVSENIFFG